MTTLVETFSAAFNLHQQGLLAEAAPLYRAVIAEEPMHAATHHLLGLIEHQEGRHEAALPLIKRAIELEDDEPNYHGNLGTVYRALGRRDEAVACYRHAIALRPSFAEAQNNLGLVLQDQNQLSGAQRAFEQAIAAKPGYAAAMVNLGNVLAARDEQHKAVDQYLAALAADPQCLDAYNNLGSVLAAMDQLDQAAECYRCVLELQPGNAAALSNYGHVLARREELDAAIASFRQAIAIQPTHAEAHVNLGNALLDQGKPHEAEASYATALRIDPMNTNTHWCRGLALLTAGDLAEGFAEWRWKPETMTRFPTPEWRGEDLNGKRIFIHAEQGFGDTIQFARYLAMIAAKGGRIIMEAPTELHRLFADIDGVEDLIVFGQRVPEFDTHCSMLSLALAFGTTLDTLPVAKSYLNADAEDMRDWERRLDGSSLKVGLVWAGRPEHKRDRQRSLSLRAMAPLATLDNVSFYALQKGAALDQAESAPAGMRLEVLSPLLGDFGDTAAAIMALDLVITVDTSVAHLAGALGKPVWLLLPFASDWRWLEKRNDSPWYPSMRLFRQDATRRWDSVMAEVTSALRAQASQTRINCNAA